MKGILLPVHSKWCKKIFNGEKTIEVRKNAPKIEPPFTVYVYMTKSKGNSKIINNVLDTVYGGGKVIGSFVCDKIIEYDPAIITCAKMEVNGAKVKEELRYSAGACLTAEEMFKYSKGKSLYGWHIAKPKLFEEPKPLWTFVKGCDDMYDQQTGGNYCEYCERSCHISRAPQSWCYVEEVL